MTRTYPVCLHLDGRLCLVVGGGAVATRKVRCLLTAGARVRVVAPSITPAITRRRRIQSLRRKYRPGDLAGCRLVFAATDDPAVNTRVLSDARAAGVPCCRTDDPDSGDFAVPASLRRGRITIAVDTGGTAPALAAAVRDRMESLLGSEYSLLSAELARLRPLLLRRIADPARRAVLLRALSGASPLNAIRRGGRAAFRRRAARLIAAAEKQSVSARRPP